MGVRILFSQAGVVVTTATPSRVPRLLLVAVAVVFAALISPSNNFVLRPERSSSTADANPPRLVASKDVNSTLFDVIVLVADSPQRVHATATLSPLGTHLDAMLAADKAFGQRPAVTLTDALRTGGRVVYASTGPLDRDYDDVRRFADAAEMGVSRAVLAGYRSPLLVVATVQEFPTATTVSALAALQKLYVPLELRDTGTAPYVDVLGIWAESDSAAASVVDIVAALEQGRIVSRDICGSDPERMAPPKVEEYLRETFRGSDVAINVTSDVAQLKANYPLLAAVNRAANVVSRHRARLVFLEYAGDQKSVNTTLFLVGKGITYDSGGADLKVGGNMVSMHRDKCGAAAVAGFMKVLSILKPAHLHVVAGLPMVRNSIGEEGYVADEIITARSGLRVRVGNTDAEGRMVMGDVLCQMKELALTAINPQIITVATLTGHAVNTAGRDYSVLLQNGPATHLSHQYQHSHDCHHCPSLQAAGHRYGDPMEVSTLRRDDYDAHKGRSVYEDILQSGNKPTTKVYRGHQGPTAFLILVSGLDKHDSHSAKPLPYSHFDIAGPSMVFPGVPSAAPLVALAAQFTLGAHQADMGQNMALFNVGGYSRNTFFIGEKLPPSDEDGHARNYKDGYARTDKDGNTNKDADGEAHTDGDDAPSQNIQIKINQSIKIVGPLSPTDRA